MTAASRVRRMTGSMGLRVANRMANATGTLQNAARASCQLNARQQTNTMAVDSTAPNSSPSTWL